MVLRSAGSARRGVDLPMLIYSANKPDEGRRPGWCRVSGALILPATVAIISRTLLRRAAVARWARWAERLPSPAPSAQRSAEYLREYLLPARAGRLRLLHDVSGRHRARPDRRGGRLVAGAEAHPGRGDRRTSVPSGLDT